MDLSILLFHAILFMGIVPMVAWTVFLRWVDRWEPEPRYLIAAAFLWGAVPAILLVSIIHAFLMEHLFSLPVMAVIVAPITEESVKAIALLILFLHRRTEIDSLLDGFIYGAAIGFGFAAVENIFYFLSAADWGAATLGFTVVLRTFVFGTNHAIFTGITGLGFALARFSNKQSARRNFPLTGLFLAMLLHGVHNYFAGQDDLSAAIIVHAIAVLGVIALMFTSLIIQRKWVRYYLGREVELGVLTQAQVDAASSFSQRWKRPGEWRRFNRLSIKLAMKKHAYARVGARGQSVREIEEIRSELLKRQPREHFEDTDAADKLRTAGLIP